MNNDLRFAAHPLPAPRSQVSLRTVLVTVFVAAVLVGAGVGYKLGNSIEGAYDAGTASPIALNGSDTGFYRLAVSRTHVEMLAAPSVEEAGANGAMSTDQETSEVRGWDAACAAWANFGVLGADQALVCATATQRPTLGYVSSSTGQSANLANALVFADHSYDISGTLRVAATGELRTGSFINATTGAAQVSSDVMGIGGVAAKTEAAVAADVDVLVVPVSQLSEFRAQPVLDGSGVTVVGAATVHGAIWELCSLSRTLVCRERVLTSE